MAKLDNVTVFFNLDKNDKDMVFNCNDLVTDKYKLKEHLNIISLLKTDEYLHDKYKRLREKPLKTNLLKYDEKHGIVKNFWKTI